MELVGGEPMPKRPRVDVEPPECYVCLQTIFPCEEIHQSWCRPVPHFTHVDCWNKAIGARVTGIDSPICGMCRQREPCEDDIMSALTACGLEYDSDKLYHIEDLPPLGGRLIELFQKGKITSRQLWDFSEVSQRVQGTWPEELDW